MRATVSAKFIRATIKHGEKPIVTGGFYQAPEDGRIEAVEFYGDPDDLKGLPEVPEGTTVVFDVTANARSSTYSDAAYLSVKLHAFRIAAPERARS